MFLILHFSKYIFLATISVSLISCVQKTNKLAKDGKDSRGLAQVISAPNFEQFVEASYPGEIGYYESWFRGNRDNKIKLTTKVVEPFSKRQKKMAEHRKTRRVARGSVTHYVEDWSLKWTSRVQPTAKIELNSEASCGSHFIDLKENRAGGIEPVGQMNRLRIAVEKTSWEACRSRG